MIDDTDATQPPEDDAGQQDADQDATDHGAPADAQPIDADAQDGDAAPADDDEPSIEEQIEQAHASVSSLIPDDYDPDQSPLIPEADPIPKRHRRPGWRGRWGAKKRLLFALKAQKAIEYRIAGYDFTEIAQFLGYKSRQAAHYAYTQGMKARTAELADEALRLDLARLDSLFRAVFPPAAQGDLTAVASAQSIIGQRAKLLGIEKPAKVAMTDSRGEDLAPGELWSATMGQAATLVAAMIAAGQKNVVPDEPDVPAGEQEKPAP